MKTVMRRLMIASSIAIIAITATVLPNRFAEAVQPSPDYKTWEYSTIITTPYGDVPFRRGFYDKDVTNRYDPNIVGEGFGTDKLEHKHGITSASFAIWVINNDPTPQYRVVNGQETSTLLWKTEVTPSECATINGVWLCDNNGGPYDVIAGAEMDIFDYYYDWPASMEGPDRSNLIPEDEAVGIITTYCDQYDGPCPSEIMRWWNMSVWA